MSIEERDYYSDRSWQTKAAKPAQQKRKQAQGKKKRKGKGKKKRA